MFALRSKIPSWCLFLLLLGQMLLAAPGSLPLKLELSVLLGVCVAPDSERLHPVGGEVNESLTLSWDDVCLWLFWATYGIHFVFLQSNREVFTETFPPLPLPSRRLLMNPKTSLPIDTLQRDSSTWYARVGKAWDCARSLAFKNFVRSFASPTKLMVRPCSLMLAFGVDPYLLCYWVLSTDGLGWRAPLWRKRPSES